MCSISERKLVVFFSISLEISTEKLNTIKQIFVEKWAFQNWKFEKKFLLNFIQNISVVTKADGDKIGKVTESVRKLMCS